MMAHKLRIYSKYCLVTVLTSLWLICTDPLLVIIEGNFRHAMNAGLLTFLAVSGMSFLICANEINQKYDRLRQAFHQQRIKEDRNNKRDSP